MKHFLPGNTQDKMNAFDGNKIEFFVKTRGYSTNLIPNSRRSSNFKKTNL